MVPDLLGEMPEICVSRDELGTLVVFPSPHFTHDDDVVTASEGVSEHSDRLQDHLRLLSDGLVARGTIVVPVGEVLNLLDLIVEGASLGAEANARSIDPDVLGNNFAVLRQVEKCARILVVEIGLHFGMSKFL